ncbi:MAG: sugar transferase [Deltaproteobacteria bacterium]|nr:sugar transferase [Deltaproteobacteria bacterium]
MELAKKMSISSPLTPHASRLTPDAPLPASNISRLTSPKISRSYLISKRVFDITFAILLLPFLLPLMAVIGVLIKLDSKGPVFFRHERIGYQGEAFKCFKFRTMMQGAQKILKDVLKQDPQSLEEWNKDFKLKNDPRITKIGKFLRKTSLDELPQILNVIKGEMSFVGPRPIIKDEIKMYGVDFEFYKNLKPGITGLWQVSGRNNVEYQSRVSLDKQYFFEQSLGLDILILIKTIPEVLKSRGAY